MVVYIEDMEVVIYCFVECFEEFGIFGFSVVFVVDGELFWVKFWGMVDVVFGWFMILEMMLFVGLISKFVVVLCVL